MDFWQVEGRPKSFSIVHSFRLFVFLFLLVTGEDRWLRQCDPKEYEFLADLTPNLPA